jgi:DNA invertase Pin-like site-specific DNA recombinase
VEAAGRLVWGRGRIVIEFFDEGSSRSVPWGKRPQAAALLAAAADPGRGFDAVVVGEFERAFTGGQAMPVIALLNSHGVQVWLPEALGPVDLTEPGHRALLMMLGHQSEREVLRSRFRTTAAMRAQAREKGRHLGGRPVWIPAGRRGPASQSAARGVGSPPASAGGGSGDRAAPAVDLRVPAGRHERRGHRAR